MASENEGYETQPCSPSSESECWSEWNASSDSDTAFDSSMEGRAAMYESLKNTAEALKTVLERNMHQSEFEYSITYSELSITLTRLRELESSLEYCGYFAPPNGPAEWWIEMDAYMHANHPQELAKDEIRRSRTIRRPTRK